MAILHRDLLVCQGRNMLEHIELRKCKTFWDAAMAVAHARLCSAF